MNIIEEIERLALEKFEKMKKDYLKQEHKKQVIENVDSSTKSG